MVNKDYFQKINYIPGSRYNLENNNILKISYRELRYGDIWHIPGEILEPYKKEVLNFFNNFCKEKLLSNRLISITFDDNNVIVSSLSQKRDHTIWYESFYDEE